MLACLAALFAIASGCRGNPTTVLTRLQDSRKLAADLRIQFGHAVDASSRAVLADTDEAATASARESTDATKRLEQDVAELERLLEGLNFSSELQILREFGARFDEYKKLDARILELSVENTNLKARALSFGVGSQAADDFQRTLESIVPSSPPANRCRIEGLVVEAELAVREIQVLHAPHIAEKDDAAMTRMEKEMAAGDARARAALDSIRELAPSAASALADAVAKLDQFKAISSRIVELSRRNTNVVALDLSLRQKPALKAACDDRLRTLQEELAKEGPKATR